MNNNNKKRRLDRFDDLDKMFYNIIIFGKKYILFR